MAELALPPNEINAFDLPPVCLVTGAEEGVRFRRVTFHWFPRWLPLLVVLTFVIGAIILAMATERVEGELPFTDEGWRRHRYANLLNLAAGFTLALAMLGSLVAFVGGHDALALVLAATALGLPLVVYLAWVRGCRVRCTDVTPELVRLEVPSASAAEVVDTFRHAGASLPFPPAPAGSVR